MQEMAGSPHSWPRGAAMTQGEGTDMDRETEQGSTNKGHIWKVRDPGAQPC